MVCMYPIFMGTRTYAWSAHVTAEAAVITNMTAPHIPRAVEIFFETPRKGQIPRKRVRTKLLTRTAPTMIRMNCAIVDCTRKERQKMHHTGGTPKGKGKVKLRDCGREWDYTSVLVTNTITNSETVSITPRIMR